MSENEKDIFNADEVFILAWEINSAKTRVYQTFLTNPSAENKKTVNLYDGLYKKLEAQLALKREQIPKTEEENTEHGD